jgi:hypothetical protein
MNRLNFNQSIGFPLETNILDEMQTGYNIFNAFGAIVGNFSIISGCTVVGTTVIDGVIFINGEVLDFKGGVVQTNVIIVETKTKLEFEDASTHDVIFTRYATFGTATTQWAWNTFKRGFETKNIPAALAAKEDKATASATVAALIGRIEVLERRPASDIPIGLIAIWDRPYAEIPAGWQEYVDLRGRMPIGLNPDDGNFNTIKGFGGDKNKTLSIAELPAHFFSYMKGIAGRGYRTASDDYPFGGSEATNTNTIGSNQSFSIMNPYRVVHFIKYVG